MSRISYHDWVKLHKASRGVCVRFMSLSISTFHFPISKVKYDNATERVVSFTLESTEIGLDDSTRSVELKYSFSEQLLWKFFAVLWYRKYKWRNFFTSRMSEELNLAPTITSDCLHITGHAMKFIDRKSSGKDKLTGSRSSLAATSKVSQMFHTDADEVNHLQKPKKISRKCPIELDSPTMMAKRRILKRPKRFETYFSVRKPLSVPCFGFPRWLIVN